MQVYLRENLKIEQNLEWKNNLAKEYLKILKYSTLKNDFKME